jgi:hypothetical protein
MKCSLNPLGIGGCPLEISSGAECLALARDYNAADLAVGRQSYHVIRKAVDQFEVHGIIDLWPVQQYLSDYSFFLTFTNLFVILSSSRLPAYPCPGKIGAVYQENHYKAQLERVKDLDCARLAIGRAWLLR